MSLLVLTASSCDDELLDKTPVTVLSGDIFTSEANFDAAVMGIYDVMQWQNIGGQHVFPMLFQDIRADNNYSQFANFWAAGMPMDDLSQLNANNFNVQLLWQKWYTGINRANLVIAEAEAWDGWEDQELRAQVIAEAKAWRGFFYFETHKMWNTVPIITEPIADVTQLPPLGRATVAEMFNRIDTDLEESIAGLPTKGEAVPGRITKGFARTMLAKSKLYQQDWDAAASWAEAVITSGQFSLEPNFGDNWLEDESNENGVESIFEIQYGDGFTSSYFEAAGTAAQGSGSWQMMFTWVSGNYTSFSNMLPTANLKAAYDYNTTNDARFFETLITPVASTPGSDIAAISPLLSTNWGLDASGGILQQANMSWLRPDIEDCNYSRKYFLSWELVDQLLEKSNSPKNESVLRYADVLLMHAEARAMGGTGTLTGQSSMDLITTRAGVPAVNASDLNAIKLQRRLELATEGWDRFSDLVRWGDAATTLAYKNFEAGKHEYLPIPQSEIDVIGADILVQNDNY